MDLVVGIKKSYWYAALCVMSLVVIVCTATVIVTSVYVMYFAVNVCTALGVTSVYVTDLFLIGEQLLV